MISAMDVLPSRLFGSINSRSDFCFDAFLRNLRKLDCYANRYPLRSKTLYPCTALLLATRRAGRSERLGCNAVRLPMNWRALFSQELSSAKLRHVSRDIVSARRQAFC